MNTKSDNKGEKRTDRNGKRANNKAEINEKSRKRQRALDMILKQKSS